ncbi:uncharacterized protein ARMOST_12362 [Armillaria ostoyae]|uniref:Uncharacterized protein n=1 Tax=Armillaria ostoyae TaxID=47428 RepID=A0A284RJQ8_ARMOS|nr:uncharacterized protein ARMOST_12362 [Armillaria ostoyae]
MAHRDVCQTRVYSTNTSCYSARTLSLIFFGAVTCSCVRSKSGRNYAGNKEMHSIILGSSFFRETLRSIPTSTYTALPQVLPITIVGFAFSPRITRKKEVGRFHRVIVAQRRSQWRRNDSSLPRAYKSPERHSNHHHSENPLLKRRHVDSWVESRHQRVLSRFLPLHISILNINHASIFDSALTRTEQLTTIFLLLSRAKLWTEPPALPSEDGHPAPIGDPAAGQHYQWHSNIGAKSSVAQRSETWLVRRTASSGLALIFIAQFFH